MYPVSRHILSVSLSRNDRLVRNRFVSVATQGEDDSVSHVHAKPGPAKMSLSLDYEFQAQVSIPDLFSTVGPRAGEL
jgi:hypothetical protein